ncbi:MAG: ester cyclase [Sinimarinibacterium sp.]|jgi:predicted ester cyclase
MRENNRALAIRWMEDSWNNRRDATIDELMVPNCIGYLEGQTIKGAAEFHSVRRELISAFPDIRIKIEGSAADGDTVVLRWRLSGTHQGAAFGLQPTGKPFDVVGSTWFRFLDGKLIEGHDTWNQGALLAYLSA